MKPIPTVRAAHLIGFVNLLGEIGTPVEHTLERAGLPPAIKMFPDALVSDILAMSFIGSCARREGIRDIGWLGVKQFQMSHLCRATNEGLAVHPTVLGRLQAFFELAKLEDANVSGGILAHGNLARVWIMEPWIKELEPHYVSEWYVIGVIIEIVRSVLGPNWCPHEITFRSSFDVAEDALAHFPNTRFLLSQTHTSIVMPRTQLAENTGALESACSTNSGSSKEPQGVNAQLSLLLPPYLAGQIPSIEQAAEMVGASVRTLQRQLALQGTSYSDLTERVRFDAARKLLLQSNAKASEIAQSVGYTSASNFSRAFRRTTGMSPSEYRSGFL